MIPACLTYVWSQHMWKICGRYWCVSLKQSNQILGRNNVQIYQARACTLWTNYNINAKYNAIIYYIRRFWPLCLMFFKRSPVYSWMIQKVRRWYACFWQSSWHRVLLQPYWGRGQAFSQASNFWLAFIKHWYWMLKSLHCPQITPTRPSNTNSLI